MYLLLVQKLLKLYLTIQKHIQDEHQLIINL
jgi:hypothetical protein